MEREGGESHDISSIEELKKRNSEGALKLLKGGYPLNSRNFIQVEEFNVK